MTMLYEMFVRPTLQWHCPRCAMHVDARHRKMSSLAHVVHFMLTAMSLGLWLPVWVGASFWPRRWECKRCQTPTRKRAGWR